MIDSDELGIVVKAKRQGVAASETSPGRCLRRKVAVDSVCPMASNLEVRMTRGDDSDRLASCS